MRLIFLSFSPDKLRPVLFALMMIGIVGTGAMPAQETSIDDMPTATVTFTTQPTLQLSPTNTPEPTLTDIPTNTPTPTITETTTSTPTMTHTATPIVETVVVPQTVVVTQPVMVTVPAPVLIMPTIQPPSSPPTAIPPPPEPVASPTPSLGWQRFESQAFIPVIGSWGFVSHVHASAGGYRQSASRGATLRFPFEGEGIKVIYRKHPMGGVFELVLDGGIQLDIITTQADDPSYEIAGPYFVGSDYHVLDVIALGPESGEAAIGIDAVEVFRGPPIPDLPEPTAPTTIPDDTARNVASIRVISAPPTPQPTPTPAPDVLVSVEIVVAYDLNRNNNPDPNEGVQGVSIRMLDASTNRLLASGLTDERGFVRLQALTANPSIVVVPYFGETFPVRSARGQAQSARWTLLLDAGTQPGLIP